MSRPKSKILAFLQTFFIPWLFHSELRQSNLFKTNQIWGSWVAVFSKWFFHKPLLVRCGYETYKNSLQAGNSGGKHMFLKWCSLLAYHQASHIWLNTKEISTFIQNTFNIISKKITVNQNWIDTNLFKFIKDSKKILNRVLYVGRFSKEKNIPLLLKALSGTNIAVDIVGNGILKGELVDLSRQLRVEVNFLDRFPNNEMPNIYNKYAVYVLCSKYEGNPKTLLEAMACELAVCGTDVPGIRDIISNGENGLLVSKDPIALRTSIQNVLSDASLRYKLGSNARKYILNNNSLAQVVDKEYSIYQKLLNNRL